MMVGYDSWWSMRIDCEWIYLIMIIGTWYIMRDYEWWLVVIDYDLLRLVLIDDDWLSLIES